MTKLVNGNMLYIAYAKNMVIGVGPSIPALQKRVNEYMDVVGYQPMDKWREEWHEHFPIFDCYFVDDSMPTRHDVHVVIKLVEYFDGKPTLAPVKDRTQ